MGALLCTLTLIPYRNSQWPRPTEKLYLTSCLGVDWDSNFAKYAPFLDDNLCISYQGKQCLGTSVKVFSDPCFQGTCYEAILEHDSGTICLPCEVKTTASSIFALLGSGNPLVASATDASAVASDSGVAAANTDNSAPTTTAPSTDLQQFYDNGLLTEEALQRLQQEDPDTLRAAIRNLQQQDPDTLGNLLSDADIPLTLDKVSELLEAAAALTTNSATPSSVSSDNAPTTSTDSASTTSTDSAPTTSTDNASTTSTDTAPTVSSDNTPTASTDSTPTTSTDSASTTSTDSASTVSSDSTTTASAAASDSTPSS